MTPTGKVDLVWALLIGLTLGGALLGESAEPVFWVTTIIAAIMVFKGRMVIDYFMELGDAHPSIRRLVRLYVTVLPLLAILTYLFGSQIAQLTAL